MKINNFRGDLTDVSSRDEALTCLLSNEHDLSCLTASSPGKLVRCAVAYLSHAPKGQIYPTNRFQNSELYPLVTIPHTTDVLVAGTKASKQNF